MLTQSGARVYIYLMHESFEQEKRTLTSSCWNWMHQVVDTSGRINDASRTDRVWRHNPAVLLHGSCYHDVHFHSWMWGVCSRHIWAGLYSSSSSCSASKLTLFNELWILKPRKPKTYGTTSTQGRVRKLTDWCAPRQTTINPRWLSW